MINRQPSRGLQQLVKLAAATAHRSRYKELMHGQQWQEAAQLLSGEAAAATSLVLLLLVVVVAVNLIDLRAVVLLWLRLRLGLALLGRLCLLVAATT